MNSLKLLHAADLHLDSPFEGLSAGKAANQDAGIQNAAYIIGNAEALPFGDAVFDVVATRLSFHHFRNPETVMREMIRVLKPYSRNRLICCRRSRVRLVAFHTKG